jgi:hypothetical protein
VAAEIAAPLFGGLARGNFYPGPMRRSPRRTALGVPVWAPNRTVLLGALRAPSAEVVIGSARENASRQRLRAARECHAIGHGSKRLVSLITGIASGPLNIRVACRASPVPNGASIVPAGAGDEVPAMVVPGLSGPRRSGCWGPASAGCAAHDGPTGRWPIVEQDRGSTRLTHPSCLPRPFEQF